MPPMYDSIGSHYEMIKRTVFGSIEQHNARKIISPLLQKPDTHVLDLGCGAGFYTQRFPEWGAASVVGVDLSPVMLEAAAARLAATPYRDRVTLRLGDVFDMPEPVDNPHRRPAPGFDVVTCIWLLVYAEDQAALTRALRAVAANLRPGGAVVVFGPPPVDGAADLAALARHTPAAATPPTGVRWSVLEPLANGQGVVMVATVQRPPGEAPDAPELALRSFRLRRSVWEEAARAAGLSGRLEWVACEPPEGMSEEEETWRRWSRKPELVALVMYKD